MHKIKISLEERDTLRGWLTSVEGALGDLQSIVLGEISPDDFGGERRSVTFTFGVLDEIGWEVEGEADSYPWPSPPSWSPGSRPRDRLRGALRRGRGGRAASRASPPRKGQGKADLAIAEAILDRCESERRWPDGEHRSAPRPR